MKAVPQKGRKNKGGPKFQYELSFMRKVIFDYLEGEESIKEVGKRYGLGPYLVSNWLKLYKKGRAPFDSVPLADMEEVREEKPSEDQESLQKENQDLQRKLSEAQLKIAGLEVLIDIAEQQLNIDIRKKSGTKQS